MKRIALLLLILLSCFVCRAQQDTPVEKQEAVLIELDEPKPTFMGQYASVSFKKWVDERLVYPNDAKEKGIQGRVTIGFTINEKGELTDVKVLRGRYPSLDAEAVRVVSSSPKWEPAKYSDGRPAPPVRYTFPVIFKL